jgi:hypothetical protein
VPEYIRSSLIASVSLSATQAGSVTGSGFRGSFARRRRPSDQTTRRPVRAGGGGPVHGPGRWSRCRSCRPVPVTAARRGAAAATRAPGPPGGRGRRRGDLFQKVFLGQPAGQAAQVPVRAMEGRRARRLRSALTSPSPTAASPRPGPPPPPRACRPLEVSHRRHSRCAPPSTSTRPLDTHPAPAV